MRNLYKPMLGFCFTSLSFSNFLVKPYFQPGENLYMDGKEERTILFEMEPDDKDIKLVLKDREDIAYDLESSLSRFNTLFYKAIFKNLEAGRTYRYQVLQKEKIIFEDEFKISNVDRPLQLTLFGCAGENTEGQKQIAGLLKDRPMDGIIYLGDFTYTTKTEDKEIRAGTATALRQNFFEPYKNVFSKIPFYSVIGNREMDASNFDTDKDAYAYFDYVCHPLNGPETMPINVLKGAQENIDSFLKHISHYQKGTNYSVDFYKGGKPLVHLQVVDGNVWMDPSQEVLQSWMQKDLEQTKAPWKIACIHQPLASCLQRLESYDDLFNEPEAQLAKFSIGAEVYNQKITNIKNGLIGGVMSEKNRVRQYAKIWQENGVQLVFSAHLHGYDRSKPLTLIPKENGIDKFEEKIGVGPTYVITGAAGAHLHLETLIGEKIPKFLKYFLPPSYFQNKFLKFGTYTAQANLVDYSFSTLKIDEKKLVLEQINKKNKIIDTFEINL